MRAKSISADLSLPLCSGRFCYHCDIKTCMRVKACLCLDNSYLKYLDNFTDTCTRTHTYGDKQDEYYKHNDGDSNESCVR